MHHLRIEKCKIGTNFYAPPYISVIHSPKNISTSLPLRWYLLTFIKCCSPLNVLPHYFIGPFQQPTGQVLSWSFHRGRWEYKELVHGHTAENWQTPVLCPGWLSTEPMFLTPRNEKGQTLNIRVPELGMAAHGMIFSICWSVFCCWFTQQEFLKLLLYFCTCHCPWNTHIQKQMLIRGFVLLCLWSI